MTDELGGALLAAAAIGGSLVAGVTVTARRLPHLHGSARVLALGVVSTAALLAVHLVPAVAGVLSRGSVATAGCVAAALSLLVPRRPAGTGSVRMASAPAAGDTSGAVLGSAAVAIVAVTIIARAIRKLGDPLTSTDVLAFDLPIVSRWIQDGDIAQVTELFPGLGSHGTYPHNGHVALLAVVLPFRGDALVGLASLPFLLLGTTAVYALGRELGARRPSAAVMASAFAAVPAVWSPALDSMTDTFMLAMFGAGVVFALMYRRTRGRSELVLAGLALGLAFGTKWYAVAHVPVVLAAAVVVWPSASDRGRRALSDAALVGVLVVLAGGLWLVRNLVETGDPLYPVRVAPLGIEIFDAPRDIARERLGFPIAHYLTDWDALREYILPAFRSSFGAAGAACAAGVAAAVAATRSGATAVERRTVWAVATAATAIAGIYLLIPYGAFGPEGTPYLTEANTRYLAPALLLGAGLAAWAVDRLGRWRPAGLAVGAAVALMGILPGGATLAAGLVLVAALLAVELAYGGRDVPLLTRLATRLAGRRLRLPRLAAVAATLVAIPLVAGLVAAVDDSRRDALRPIPRWLHDQRAPRRVALAGFWNYPDTTLAWSLHGLDARNAVFPVGGVTRGRPAPPSSSDEFVSAVRRERADVVIVSGAGAKPTEADWARAAGFAPILRDGKLELFARPTAER